MVATFLTNTVGHGSHLECQAICADDQDCEAFVWVKADGGCWLRKGATVVVPLDKDIHGYVAGPKRCPLGSVKAISHDLENFYPLI